MRKPRSRCYATWSAGPGGTMGGSGALDGGFSVEGDLELVWQGWK
jgi:hypothetical protein